MSLLFIDSSYDITLGLLDENLGWHDLREFRGQRASSTLQTETHRLLKDFEIPMNSLAGVFSIAGPGFYTGLRLSEGFADVTSFFGIPHYSFYSHEIPSWLGYSKGTWVTKAYRGEYFFYEWSANSGKVRLLESKDLVQPEEEVFIHSEASLDEKLRPLVKNAVSTTVLLKNEPQRIFSRVLKEKLKRESYYFRAPEDEFRMNP